MIKSTRRDLLKTAIGSSGVLWGCHQGTRNSSDKLVIVLHGTYAFSYDPTKPEPEQLTVVAPCVTSHVYRAGNFTEEAVLSSGGYRLQNVSKGNASSPNKKKFSVVQRINTGDPSASNVTIKMPWPHKFRGLRTVKPVNTSQAPVDLFQDGTTKSQNDVRPDETPLIYILTYKNISNPSLVDDNSVTKWTYVSGKNLHIIAEPEHSPNESHVHDALGALNALFAVELDLAYNPDLNPDIQGVITADPDQEVADDEQKALCERLSFSGTRIRNCQAIVVT